jgi:hypothetical protein
MQFLLFVILKLFLATTSHILSKQPPFFLFCKTGERIIYSSLICVTNYLLYGTDDSFGRSPDRSVNEQQEAFMPLLFSGAPPASRLVGT